MSSGIPTLGNLVSGKALVVAINDALNNSGATGVLPAGVGAADMSYIIPGEIITTSSLTVVTNSSIGLFTGGSWVSSSQKHDWISHIPTTYATAVFTGGGTSTVPLPSVLLLFATGLGLLVWNNRRNIT